MRRSGLVSPSIASVFVGRRLANGARALLLVEQLRKDISRRPLDTGCDALRSGLARAKSVSEVPVRLALYVYCRLDLGLGW